MLAALLDLGGLDAPRRSCARGWPSGRRTTTSARRAGSWTSPPRSAAAPGHALFLDCRDDSVEQMPFDLAADGLAVLVIDTRAPHRARRRRVRRPPPRLRGGRRGARRAGAARRRLDRPRRRAGPAAPTSVTRRRVRHVVTENQRVLDTVGAAARRPGPRDRPAADRLARLDARRLRDHRARARHRGRGGAGRRRARRPDDRRRLRRLRARAGRGRPRRRGGRRRRRPRTPSAVSPPPAP